MLCSLVGLLACLASGPSPVVFLFPEDLEDAQNVTLEAQLPEPGIALFAKDPDRPKLWYAPVAAHAEGDGVLLWYQRVNSGEKEYSDQRTLCLGELRGGQWLLPELQAGAPAWGGPNNVCLRRSLHKPTWGGFNVFQIVRAEPGFRMLYWDQPAAEGESGAMLTSSSDGRAWEKDPGGAVFTEHNDAFTLLPKDGGYLLYQTMLEDWPEKPYPDNLDKKRRVQALRESPDLRTWTAQMPLLRPDAEDRPETEFYLMKAFPHGGAYLGLVMKYYADPNLPNKHSALLEYELTVSRDARTWQRPFRNTDLGFWSYADPFPYQGRLHFAIWKDGGMQTVAYAPNRLTAVVARESGAFTTPVFPWPENGLVLDADARGGRLEAQLLDAAGTAVADAAPVRFEDREGAALALPWAGVTPGTECRVRFHMRAARVYALTAAETPATRDKARIALLRGVPEKWALDANFETFLKMLDKASVKHADIFVTPECWLDGYAAPDKASTPERLRGVAQDLDASPYLRRVAEEARSRRMYICFGFTSLEDGAIYNAAGLWDAGGRLVGVYHKTHLQTHDLQYAAGMALPVWPSPWGPLGIMICADRRWPETARALRLQGARLILNPTYGFHGEFNEAMMRTRAFENQCFIAFTHPEESLVAGPGGKVLARRTGGRPGILVCDLDLSAATDDNHLRDRRPDLYGVLARP